MMQILAEGGLNSVIAVITVAYRLREDAKDN
jgi:hypothetical protein